MKKSFAVLICFALSWFAAAANAQLVIEITKSAEDAVPVAIVPFGWESSGAAPFDVAEVVAADLRRSGRFAPLDRKEMIDRPTQGDQIRFQDWRYLKTDFIAVGKLVPEGTGFAAQFELYNVLTGQRLAGQRLTANANAMRALAHRISDIIFEQLTGVRGAFSTRVAFVSAEGTPPKQRYTLIVSDYDGENQQIITSSDEPIMSPAWSPDGKTLALTLSRKDGDVDVYTLGLNSQVLTRMTFDPGIDTEPSWSSDGKKLYFNSDRAGGPQIYEVDVANPNRATRVSFEGSYNARPRVSPDGKQLSVVHLDRGNYRIAVIDLASKGLQVLSEGRQDESPSYAPNGAVLIYATQEKGRGVLATVSTDGRTAERFTNTVGEVREPVWAPFPQR